MHQTSRTIERVHSSDQLSAACTKGSASGRGLAADSRMGLQERQASLLLASAQLAGNMRKAC